MSIADLIRKRSAGKIANANPANSANSGHEKGQPLARLATLALAAPPNDSPADKRIEIMISKLESEASLRYAMKAHDDLDPEAVILSLAIRGKGACEFRIPKSSYDAFALLELIDKHTKPETLQ